MQLGYMQTNDHLNGIATTEDAVRSQLFKDFVIQRLLHVMQCNT